MSAEIFYRDSAPSKFSFNKVTKNTQIYKNVKLNDK